MAQLVKEEKRLIIDTDLLEEKVNNANMNVLTELYQEIGAKQGDISPDMQKSLNNAITQITTIFMCLAEENKPNNVKLCWLT